MRWGEWWDFLRGCTWADVVVMGGDFEGIFAPLFGERMERIQI